MTKPSSRISYEIALQDELHLAIKLVPIQATSSVVEMKEVSNMLRRVQNAQNPQLDGEAKEYVDCHRYRPDRLP